MKNNNFFKFDTYKYEFLQLYPDKKDVFILIHNKKNNNNEELLLKIMYEKYICLKKLIINSNVFNIGDFEDYKFIENDTFIIFQKISDFNEKFEDFDFEYYVENNNMINCTEKDYLMNHWYYCGRYNKYFYFKYLLKKYAHLILDLKHSKIKYDSQKNNTLLFIDNRYDSSFLYILKLFLYSVDESWNLKIYTTKENIESYNNDLNKLEIETNINILEVPLMSIKDYNKLLRNPDFWNEIKEENILLFQYDSIALGKFKSDFLNYNYIGAEWGCSDNESVNLYIGNGGTSFRKARIMEMICKKYGKIKIKKEYNEDLFICNSLFKEGLHNCSLEIANSFSCENIFNPESIYGHQIYNNIDIDTLEKHIKNKLEKMKIK